MYASAGMAEDMSGGFIARLRSLPIPRSAVLVGRALADTGIQAWGLAITVAIGLLVGFRVHGGWESAAVAAALVVLFGFVFEWAFVLIGMIAGSAQAAQGFTLLVFPFTFISSAYVPVATMPSWMRGLELAPIGDWCDHGQRLGRLSQRYRIQASRISLRTMMIALAKAR